MQLPGELLSVLCSFHIIYAWPLRATVLSSIKKTKYVTDCNAAKEEMSEPQTQVFLHRQTDRQTDTRDYNALHQ